MKTNVTQVSKFLSLVLRHKPDEIGLSLDANGWASVPELIEKINKRGQKLDMPTLELVVETNNKKRFAFNEDKTMIRASQGHSVEVDLGYTPQTPPDTLFHGTTDQFVASIQREGIQKRNRQHVHLSADIATATNVGARHGKPFILTVLAKQMQADGYHFFISDNGVWLTDFVPPQYIVLPK